MIDAPEEVWVAVYDLLAAAAGADPRPVTRAAFVWHMGDGCEEWRFGGRLGFGGKFWPGRFTVTCYPEDATPERAKVIELTNTALGSLAAATERCAKMADAEADRYRERDDGPDADFTDGETAFRDFAARIREGPPDE